jgi:predicted DNA-binding antitoxin AbrB/MazE fold protein
MDQSFLATFEDGVLKPHDPLGLPPHSQVRVTVELVTEVAGEQQRVDAWNSVERLWNTSTLDSGGDRLTREQLHERR